MTWTKEVPKVDGWYWVCGDFIRPPEVWRREFDRWWMHQLEYAHSHDELVEDQDPGDYMNEPKMFLGPIEVPQPPEVE